MSNSQSQAQWDLPIMTLDIKKHRVRLYKQSLRLLGDPEYVQFLVNPDKQFFIVRRGSDKDVGVHKIYWTIINENHYCCEFYSKYFIEALQSLFSAEDDNQSYRIIGKYSKRHDFIVYNLKESEPITYEQEAINSDAV